MNTAHILAHGSPLVRRLNVLRALDGIAPIVTHYTRATPTPAAPDRWMFSAQLLSGRVRVKCARCGRVQDRRAIGAGRKTHGCAV